MIKKFGDQGSERTGRHMKGFLCQSVISTKLGQVQGAVGHTGGELEQAQRRAFLIEGRGVSMCKGKVA